MIKLIYKWPYISKPKPTWTFANNMNKKATQFFQKQVLFFFSTVAFSPVTPFIKDTASIDLLLFFFVFPSLSV